MEVLFIDVYYIESPLPYMLNCTLILIPELVPDILYLLRRCKTKALLRQVNLRVGHCGEPRKTMELI